MSKNIIKLINLIMIAIMLGLVVGCSNSQTVEKEKTTETETGTKTIELRLTHINSTLHPTHKGFEKFAEEVKQKTNGKVEIMVYPSDTLNSPFETYNAIINGLADIGRAPVGYTPAIMPLNKLFGDALMGVKTCAEADQIWTEAYNNLPELQAELQDIQVLWLNSTSPLSICTINTPVRKLEDLKGLILRVPPGLEPLAKAWGASPVNMPVGDIYVGLEKNTIDGFFGNAEMLYSMKLADFTKYANNVYMTYALSYVGMNKEIWNSLPTDVQDVFNELSDWARLVLMESFDEGERQAREFALSQGCEFIELDDAELERFNEISMQVFKQMAADLEKEGKPANKIINELEKIQKKRNEGASE